MLLSWVSVKQSLQEVTSLALDVFISGQGKGWRRTVLFVCTCGVSSLLLSSLLLLYLLFALDCELSVAGGVAGCFWALLTAASFLSRRARCLGTLFVVSFFMKKSRNLLLTAGTSVVVLKNLRNTVENLRRLVQSVVCNLKAKKASIAAPFSNYIKMLKWVGSLLKGVTDLAVVQLDSQLKVSPRIESETFKLKLSEAEEKLNETMKHAQAIVATVSSVSERLLPAVSFLVLTLVIALHIKKYCGNVKYENRFISKNFVLFDKKQKAEGKPHVLPLTAKEEKLYPFIPSARPTIREGRAALRFGAPVMSHAVTWIVFMTVDALLYFFIHIVTKKLSELKPFHVPLIISFKGVSTLVGIPFGEDNQQKDLSYSVTLFEEECLPEPELLLWTSVFPLSAILLTLLFMSLMAAKVSQLRLMVCERFFTAAGDTRVEYLHDKILRRRRKLRMENDDCSFKSLIVKPHFWCPMLFCPKDDPQSIA